MLRRPFLLIMFFIGTCLLVAFSHSGRAEPDGTGAKDCYTYCNMTQYNYNCNNDKCFYFSIRTCTMCDDKTKGVNFACLSPSPLCHDCTPSDALTSRQISTECNRCDCTNGGVSYDVVEAWDMIISGDPIGTFLSECQCDAL